MAVSTFSFDDFKNLFGKDISFEDLKELSFDYGIEVEGDLSEEGEFSVDVTPERPDLYCVEGFARSLRGFNSLETGLKSYVAPVSGVELIVDPKTADIRPFIGAAVVRNVTVDDHLLRSIIRFQEKLHLTLGRKRHKVAIGVYDFDKVTPPIHYRAVVPSEESFVPLEFDTKLTLDRILTEHPMGSEYAHLLEGFDLFPLLVDSLGEVLSFPPIINSNYSGKVTPDTKNLFIEVTGTHRPTLIKTVNMLTTALADRDTIIESVDIKHTGDLESMSYESPVFTPSKISLNLSLINDYLGVSLDPGQVTSFLERMRYGVTSTKEKQDIRFDLQIPCYRVDVLDPCDVVEDIAIAFGYGNFEFQAPRTFSMGKGHPREEFSSYVRDACVEMGLVEVMTFVLSNTQDQYHRMKEQMGLDYVSLLNSKSAGHEITRVKLVPELLKFLRYNKVKATPISIFEVDDCILVDKDSANQTRDIRKFAFAEMGANTEFSRARSLVSGFFDSLNLDYCVRPGTAPHYFEGRSGEVYIGENKDVFVGSFGEVHPSVLTNFDLELPAVVGEFNLDVVEQYVKSPFESK
ncbi:phenylalanine--tRNA ligase subunit beta [Candidatus Woesearchaeota archaeon]|jgi:phenylalanyl-tRNA synthetase beta chain|nr:phenylalanine--tRNA ligase subunit beta [Candidatus Woesearchaeota archaeon]